ncbi:unnamed protein product [Ambrosiozyma monospora]|uniref:Unnamed protein product n=1 Tax=Ambrosiozyma monospora TaxID=43982 RepID=A0ACB5TXD4_AMBMO|nr:unnamed protein product [Ambrosiozyma monospora]
MMILSSSPIASANNAMSSGTYNGVSYSLWNSHEYDILPMIDNREVKSQKDRDFFPDGLNAHGIQNITKDLPVGDGIWVARHKKTQQLAVLDFIYERKRLDDFRESIKDGRFREQKLRLTRTGLKRIYYFVEEQMSSDVSSFAEALQTCMAMNITYSDIHIKRTKDINDTLTLIIEMTKSIKKYYKHKTLAVIEPRDFNSQDEFAGVLNDFRNKFKKTGSTLGSTNKQQVESVYHYQAFHTILGKTTMISVKELFLKMLLTIRGISLEKAVCIQQIYKTPRGLLQAFERYDGKKETMVSDSTKLEIGARKIGPALSRKVYLAWSDEM